MTGNGKPIDGILNQNDIFDCLKQDSYKKRIPDPIRTKYPQPISDYYNSNYKSPLEVSITLRTI